MNYIKEAAKKVMLDFVEMAGIDVSVFDFDKPLTEEAPGTEIKCPYIDPDKLAYSVVHMYVDENGRWQMKWVNDE